MNSVNSRQFHADLAEIADLATPVDLHARVLHGSKRQSQRRTALVSIAAFAIVAASGAAFALAPRSNDSTEPGSVPTVSSTDTTSPETPPTPTGSTAPSSAPASDTSGTSNVSAKLTLGPWTTSSGKQSLPGTLYYLTGATTGSTEPIKINLLAGGILRTTTLRGPVGQYGCARQSIVFSPDGNSVAWVEGGNQQSNSGTLVVASLHDGGQKVVTSGPVRCDGGSGPKWMPDSRGLIVSTAHGNKADVNIVNVNTGATTAAPAAWGDYLAWSANGAYVAYAEQDNIVVATAAGTVTKRVPYDINCCTGGFSVQSISNDGRYVGVSYHNSDPSTVRNAMKIVDLTTGKEVDLGRTPPPNGSIQIILTGTDRLFCIKITDTSTDVELNRPGNQESLSIPLTGQPQIRAYHP
ncbi:hypothetical protein GCM10010399_69860 [Dactylosporangium fulvum]|uniref:Uncharacterized protein n=1 Tax=Dactylosporangium fulvum TaxID=53359 RepID=A0ABY5W103_9ACTN|nr:hypothetical protein [Dactylosporangium fulvum]UWP83590.1 hypothetical protein Dfulv_04735 [Dactylosporangium fulvum]